MSQQIHMENCHTLYYMNCLIYSSCKTELSYWEIGLPLCAVFFMLLYGAGPLSDMYLKKVGPIDVQRSGQQPSSITGQQPSSIIETR